MGVKRVYKAYGLLYCRLDVVSTSSNISLLYALVSCIITFRVILIGVMTENLLCSSNTFGLSEFSLQPRS